MEPVCGRRLQLTRRQEFLEWYWVRTRDKASHDPIPIPLGYRGHEPYGEEPYHGGTQHLHPRAPGPSLSLLFPSVWILSCDRRSITPPMHLLMLGFRGEVRNPSLIARETPVEELIPVIVIPLEKCQCCF
ncbi:hypothetical protein TNCV_2111211 [Trichonephila clavipes]|nr:hypothetical protein TNCV_2111211 [Trichonephila clavipes]